MIRSLRSSILALVLLLGAATVQGAAGQATTTTTFCDSACLSELMANFIQAVTTNTPGLVPLADQAEIRENAKPVALTETAWKRVKTIKSVMTFSDPVSGNVASRAGVELVDGKPGYISTRLRVGPGGRITDIEISADTSARVVASYVWNLDPLFSAVLPVEQRMSRENLEALARRYFHSLSTHVAVTTDFDERCDRYHSGERITNTTRNTVEGGSPRTCASSLEGDRPWGPATEQRFPVIDPERGIVLGITLLHYPKHPNQQKMYVSEVFKVVSGRIVKIDNIGLMLQGINTLGFVH
ncbi:MAG: hypothetical protein KatS3mg005_0791 [Bryobacteraceae bacterium]|nr:MAG: hypothetical protein KatS3mg005_0791 [Bryobacteraceae bacterium]